MHSPYTSSMPGIFLPWLLALTACTSILGDDFEVVPASDAETGTATASAAGGTGGSTGSSPDGAGGTGGGEPAPPPPLNPGAIAAGGFHSCAKRADDTVKCWGRNDFGQLGAGTTSVASGPVTTVGPATFVALTAGSNFTCGLKPSGKVSCWGANAHGQLGTGSLTPAVAPDVEVVALSNVEEINAVAYSVCARKGNGSVWCWGDDVDNTLGDANNPATCESMSYPEPITCPVTTPQLASVTGTVMLGRGLPRSNATGGANRSCALRSNDAIWCWGPGAPVALETIASIVSLGAGAGFGCAVSSDGVVRCFDGSNLFGQLGNGTTTPPPEGISEVALPPTALIAVGNFTACAVLEDRTVMCWGENTYGQLGSGSIAPYSATPVAVVGLDEVIAIALSPRHACALRADDTVWCWGDNQYAQLGTGAASSNTPVQVQGI